MLMYYACRRINKSPMSLEEPEKSALKKMLTEPPVKKIDLHFPLGLEVTARNLKGVTIKDALDAIYKQYRKKVCIQPRSILTTAPLHSSPSTILIFLSQSPVSACFFESLADIPLPQADDELENPILAGFEWDKEESWTRLIVHCKKEGAPQPKKKSKKSGQEGDEL